MQSIQFLGLLTYMIGAVVICAFMLLCGYFLGGRSYSRFKNVPFESGIASIGNARIKFSIKFYLIAMVFVVFDVESIYLYIWSISMRDLGWLGLIKVLVFILILLISLIYVIRTKAFVWNQISKNYNHNKFL